MDSSAPTPTARLTPWRVLVVAFSWMTVMPMPTPNVRIDRRTGAAVLAVVPVVGLTLGLLAAAVGFGLSHTALPGPMTGAVLAALMILLTRGMHIDGLADTVDGLGCYGPPERVAEVMRSGSVGPFGACAIAVVVLIEALGFGALAEHQRFAEIVLVVFLARVAAVMGARRGLPPAHPEGFGALVAGTQRISIVAWSGLALAFAACLGFSTDGYALGTALRATMVVLVVLGGAWLFTAHCARRMGGISGDVLGAVIEGSIAVALIGLLL